MATMNDVYFADIELVGDAVELLIGSREEEFPLERALRLFQFKSWLLDGSKTSGSFSRSALIFAAIAISVKENSKRFNNLTPSI